MRSDIYCALYSFGEGDGRDKGGSSKCLCILEVKRERCGRQRARAERRTF